MGRDLQGAEADEERQPGKPSLRDVQGPDVHGGLGAVSGQDQGRVGGNMPRKTLA